jgi:trypsin
VRQKHSSSIHAPRFSDVKIIRSSTHRPQFAYTLAKQSTFNTHSTMFYRSFALTSIYSMAILASPLSSNKRSISIKVVGGTAAEAGDFPFIVAVRRGDRPLCGGSLLNPTTVLTAAHCCDMSDRANLTIRAGSLVCSDPRRLEACLH